MPEQLDLPWLWPVDDPDHTVTSEYGEVRDNGYIHEGRDLRARGNPNIVAPTSGVIARASLWNGTLDRWENYGNHVVLAVDGSDHMILLAHMKKLTVVTGQRVKRGQVVGVAGHTGNTKDDQGIPRDHLHLHVTHPDGRPAVFGQLVVDPRPLFSSVAPPPPPGPPLPPPAPHDHFPLLGLHDVEGGAWLASQSIPGWCVATEEIGLSAQRFDYTRLAAKGVRVLVRLNHGYGAAGTIPAEEHYPAFADAVVRTIEQSRGAYGWILGNEINNPNEWPGGEHSGRPISPEQYGRLWNLIWFRIPPNVPLIPAPIDPYFGGLGDTRTYWRRVCEEILRGKPGRPGGADGLAFHPKLQWHDPALVRSSTTFADPPLLGFPYHWRAWRALWDVTPVVLKRLPIHLTECNPQRRAENGELGWADEDGGVIAEMLAHTREQNAELASRIKSVVLYRWPRRDAWGMEQKASLVRAVRAAAGQPS